MIQLQEFERLKNEFENKMEEGLSQARMEYEQEMQKIERRHHLELEVRFIEKALNKDYQGLLMLIEQFYLGADQLILRLLRSYHRVIRDT